MADKPTDISENDGGDQANMLATVLEAPVSKFAVNTIRKLDLAFSSGVEGIYHFVGGGKLLEYNARRRAVVKRYIQRVVTEIENMSDDEITQAPMSIEAVVIEKLSVTEDNYISEILTKLLLASSSKEHCSKVHPSLIDAASNISPDEAFILDFMSSYGRRIMMISANYTDRRRNKSGQYHDIRHYYSMIDGLKGIIFRNPLSFTSIIWFRWGCSSQLRGFYLSRRTE